MIRRIPTEIHVFVPHASALGLLETSATALREKQRLHVHVDVFNLIHLTYMYAC